MHAEHPVARVAVVGDVERAVAGGHDRRVVHDRRALDADERAVARACDGARLELGEREAVRPRFSDPRGAEVRRALEVHDGLPERVLGRRRRLEVHRLYGVRVADPDVCELGRVVHAEVVRDALVGGIEQSEPDRLAVRLALVERQAHAFLVEINLDRALRCEFAAWQEAAQLSQTAGRAGAGPVASDRSCGRGSLAGQTEQH